MNKGADSTRGNDAANLQKAVASWLMKSVPIPSPPIFSWDKTGCRFYNDATGRLLCSVDYDWDDEK